MEKYTKKEWPPKLINSQAKNIIKDYNFFSSRIDFNVIYMS